MKNPTALIYSPSHALYPVQPLTDGRLLFASSALGLLQFAKQRRPQLIVLEKDGTQAIGQELLSVLKQAAPDARVMVVDPHSDGLIAELDTDETKGKSA